MAMEAIVVVMVAGDSVAMVATAVMVAGTMGIATGVTAAYMLISNLSIPFPLPSTPLQLLLTTPLWLLFLLSAPSTTLLFLPSTMFISQLVMAIVISHVTAM